MTILDMDPAVDSVSAISIPPRYQLTRPRASLETSDVSIPQINLRKRSATIADPKEPEQRKLATVNSAFLSGLFADVAEVQKSSVLAPPQELSDLRLENTRSLKKTRVSKSKSLTRCERSSKILKEDYNLISTPSSPTGITEPILPHSTLQGKDSLHMQLNCVSSEGERSASGSPIFPHLPATVSNTSCSTSLSRNNSDLQSSVTEQKTAESYGWFVEMDDGAPDRNANSYAATTTPTVSLAFSALSAPKATNQDAEVEWAKAADTVDDVLGDFF